MAIGISFKLAQHTIRKVPVVEVFMDDIFIATVTPNDAQDGVRVVSKHIDTAIFDKTEPLMGDVLAIDFKVKA